NPFVSAMEIVDLGAISINFDALITIHQGVSDINKSTYGNNTFKVFNNSDLGGKITSVTFDISTAAMYEMVFDPYGTAGDIVPKDFTIDTDPLVVGYTSHLLGTPHGNGGFQSVTINFNDFEPGEWFGFSIDADPTSTEGMPQPGPNDNASVSGLELAGGTMTVTFSGGTTYISRLFSDGSNAGAVACLNANTPAAPTLSLLGGGTTGTVGEVYVTLRVTGGEPFGNVALLEEEAGFFETAPGAQNQDPYETNSLISMRRITGIPLDAAGEGIIKVTALNTDAEGGYNIYMVAAEDGNGCFGSASNDVIVKYDPIADPVGAFYVNTGGKDYFSADREIFGKDQYYSPTPGRKSNNNASIPNSDDDVLYQSDHWDIVPFSYNFPTGDGTFEVTLYFVETYYNTAGNRLFQLDVEGVSHFTDFDIYAEALADPSNTTGSGKEFAIKRTFLVNVTDGNLNLDFYKGATGADNPKINGIQVKPVPAGIFPVTWLGKVQAEQVGESVQVSWATANEQNTDRFIVERSSNGSAFIETETLRAAGNSFDPIAYQSLDLAPGVGMLRYRVKQIDQNGAFTYSNSVELMISSEGVRTFPNPASELLNLSLPSSEVVLHLVLSDLAGRELLRSSFESGSERQAILMLDEIPDGVYILLVSSPRGIMSAQKVVVRK
ncbi:MAG: malectin domain-containing carbohydrate-binding protein, partial [Bacteroidia bacterium]|nr:malectin domain-containing carbohydrate-binding protein [Bacteroidia bacterium]